MTVAVDETLRTATIAVLAEHGWSGVTLERVAEKVGRSRVTLWRQGLTVETLLDSLLDALADDYRDTMWPVLAGSGTGREGLVRTLEVARMAGEAGLPCTPHSANLTMVTLFTMHMLGAIANAGKYLEFSIEGADYYPWQEGLFVRSPYDVIDGHVTIPSEPGWGVDIDPAWLSAATYQMSEAG